jgi:general secretion pathway protein D
VANIIGILNAQVGKSNFVVVSAPQVLTLDNQEAEINVGQDVPVRVNSFTNVTGTQSNSFEYRPVGIKLKFTPQVNKNRMVTINLFQEVKSLIPSSDPTANPTIAKKDIKTFVRVQDGQTIVIGGLVSNDRTATISKVPILGELPLIGFIFRRTETITKRRNLMVFITPHILTNRAIADKVTEDLHQDQIKEYKRNSID